MKNYLLIAAVLCVDCSGNHQVSVDTGLSNVVEDTYVQPLDSMNVDSSIEDVYAEDASPIDISTTDTNDLILDSNNDAATSSDVIIDIASDSLPKTLLGKYVMTWYSFQDNTPVNSALTASGRIPLPYVSVAVPFRLLKDFGGKLNYGDKLYVEFLDGRIMPNGMKHSGWVQLDDFCGDSGDDSYCFQKVGGVKYPNVDLYVGDFVKSGIDSKTCVGPVGNGQELTNLSSGDPGSDWISDYGGATLGSGKCGDLAIAKAQQSCWYYTPPAVSCADCTKYFCSSW